MWNWASNLKKTLVAAVKTANIILSFLVNKNNRPWFGKKTINCQALDLLDLNTIAGDSMAPSKPLILYLTKLHAAVDDKQWENAASLNTSRPWPIRTVATANFNRV